MKPFFSRCPTIIVLLLVLINIPSESLAGKWQVELSHSGADPLGARIASEVRKVIQNSASFGTYDGTNPIWAKVVLVTTYIDDKKNNLLSCYSVAVVICCNQKKDTSTLEQYVSSWVGICGAKRVRETAEGIIDGVSKRLPALSIGQPEKESLK